MAAIFDTMRLFRTGIVLGLLALTADANPQASATTALVITNACGVNPKCTVEAGKVTRMGWLKVDDIRHRDPARAVTYKIITIINTVANTTKTSIDLGNMPESFTPPHTNADGTKVEFVTYTHRGQVHTTTVAYPTVFFFWEDNYNITGNYEAIGPSGELECVRENRTVELTTYPQPPGPGDQASEEDPLGWSFSQIDVCFGGKNLAKNIDLFPTNPTIPHSAFQTCAVTDGDGCADTLQFGGQWLVVAETSTIFESEGDGGDGPDKPDTSQDISSDVSSDIPGATPPTTESSGLSMRVSGRAGIGAALLLMFYIC